MRVVIDYFPVANIAPGSNILYLCSRHFSRIIREKKLSRALSVLFIGDVVGEPGMKALRDHLPSLREKYAADCTIVNGENVVNGKGLSETEAAVIFSLGAQVITTGNHIWENWKSRPLLISNPNVLRPFNYPHDNPGRGYTVVTLPTGHEMGVLQLQGRIFIQTIDCPFKQADFALTKLYNRTKLIIVDMHAEATAEKIAMGWYLDGRVSAVIGTHTHVQTADECLLPKGTAYITDVGMTGPYDSVLGMKKDIALKRMLLQTAHKYEVAESDARICGAAISVDPISGHALSIERFMVPEPPKKIATTTEKEAALS
jgi:2',3'-cyclic-nucleotide 2'-phosphodiesterase